MTAVYRMTDEGWTPNQAFAEMKKYKFGADFLHSEFKDFVYSYHADAHVLVAAKAGSSTAKARADGSYPAFSHETRVHRARGSCGKLLWSPLARF